MPTCTSSLLPEQLCIFFRQQIFSQPVKNTSPGRQPTQQGGGADRPSGVGVPTNLLALGLGLAFLLALALALCLHAPFPAFGTEGLGILPLTVARGYAVAGGAIIAWITAPAEGVSVSRCSAASSSEFGNPGTSDMYVSLSGDIAAPVFALR